MTGSNQLARYLRGLGVAPDRLVAIYTERSVEMVVGMIAVHKAGGAYVPLDPNYPQERVRFIQKDADAAIMLAQASLVTKLSHEVGVTRHRIGYRLARHRKGVTRKTGANHNGPASVARDLHLGIHRVAQRRGH
jgi:non-ribosomal peptide synthetase component F